MPACPQCHTDYPPDDVNVGEGFAYCRACDQLTSLSDLLPYRETDVWVASDGPTLAEVDVDQPPRGCRVRDLGSRIVITASARSLPAAAFMLPFAIAWNASLAMFITLAGPVSAGLGGPPTIFIWLFLTPFFLVGLITAAIALIALAGEYRVTLSGPDAALFTGVGPLGWTRPLDTTDLTDIRLGHTSHHRPCIELVSPRMTWRFASALPDERRAWMTAALRQFLLPGNRPR